MQVSFGSTNHQTYTNNGNPYRKTSSGKIIGTTTMGMLGMIASIPYLKSNKHNIKNLIIIFLDISIYSSIGTGIGAIVDHFRNKSRKTEADISALYNNVIDQNA